MEKLSSVLKLINELFKKHKSAGARGRVTLAGWQPAGCDGSMSPVGLQGGAEDATAPVPSHPRHVWGGLLAFSQKENNWKLLNSVFKTNN